MKKLSVSLYQRRSLELGNYSIEAVFREIGKHPSSDIITSLKVSCFVSKGILPRLYNCLEAIFRQGDINHITGDVHYLALFLRKKRTIITVHDCVFMENRTWFKAFLIKTFWITLPLKRCTLVTTVSQATKHCLLRWAPFLLSESIRVVPSVISSAFTPLPKIFERERPIILQIGTTPNKNLDRLVAALEGISCRLRIIGELSKADVSSLQQHGIDFEASCRLSEAQVIDQYRQADIVTFVSTAEGFGMPIVEAQTVERVVVTSNCSSMLEVAGDAACFVDPYDINSIRDGILRVIIDTAYRESLIQRGRVNRQRFNPGKVAKIYEEIYYEVCRASTTGLS